MNDPTQLLLIGTKRSKTGLGPQSPSVAPLGLWGLVLFPESLLRDLPPPSLARMVTGLTSRHASLLSSERLSLGILRRSGEIEGIDAAPPSGPRGALAIVAIPHERMEELGEGELETFRRRVARSLEQTAGPVDADPAASLRTFAAAAQPATRPRAATQIRPFAYDRLRLATYVSEGEPDWLSRGVSALEPVPPDLGPTALEVEAEILRELAGRHDEVASTLATDPLASQLGLRGGCSDRPAAFRSPEPDASFLANLDETERETGIVLDDEMRRALFLRAKGIR